jgi:hypothetical protein
VVLFKGAPIRYKRLSTLIEALTVLRTVVRPHLAISTASELNSVHLEYCCTGLMANTDNDVTAAVPCSAGHHSISGGNELKTRGPSVAFRCAASFS